MLKPFKYIVQAVAVEEDETGAIVAEHTSSPTALYGRAAVTEFLDKFEAQLNDNTPTPAPE